MVSTEDLLTQRVELLQQIDTEYNDASRMSIRFGCDCGCGGYYVSDYFDELESDLDGVESELEVQGISFNKGAESGYVW